MNDHAREDCQLLLGSISEYIDGELPAELCREIEKHLETCQDCRVVFNTTRRTIDLIHSTEEEGELPAEVRQRLFMRLDLSAYLPSESK